MHVKDKTYRTRHECYFVARELHLKLVSYQGFLEFFKHDSDFNYFFSHQKRTLDAYNLIKEIMFEQ